MSTTQMPKALKAALDRRLKLGSGPKDRLHEACRAVGVPTEKVPRVKVFGNPDLMIYRADGAPGMVVFIDEEVWHNRRPLWTKRLPETWKNAVQETQARDRKVDIYLRGRGWVVVRLWTADTTPEKVKESAEYVKRVCLYPTRAILPKPD